MCFVRLLCSEGKVMAGKWLAPVDSVRALRSEFVGGGLRRLSTFKDLVFVHIDVGLIIRGHNIKPFSALQSKEKSYIWPWLKNMYQHGTLVNGTKDFLWRNPSSLILSHIHLVRTLEIQEGRFFRRAPIGCRSWHRWRRCCSASSGDVETARRRRRGFGRGAAGGGWCDQLQRNA